MEKLKKYTSDILPIVTVGNLPIAKLPIATKGDLPIIKLLTLIFFLLFAPTNLLYGQQVLTVDNAIEIALKNNPEIKSRGLDIQSAQSLSKTSGELPKMDVNFQFGNNNDFAFNDGIMISQTIPFPSLFGARKSLIGEQVKGKEWLKQLSENELKKQVRTYFYQLEYLEYNAQKLRSLDSIYLDFVRVAELRYKTGDTRKTDISTAQIKRGEIELLFRQNEVLRRNAYKNLRTLMQTEEDFITNSEQYQPMQISEMLDSSAVVQHPLIQALYQEARVAEQSQKVERAGGLPDFTLGYNNISLIGEHVKNGTEQWYGRGQRFSYFDVGIAIPLTFGAAKAKVRSLEFQKQSIEMTAQWQQQQLLTELENNMNQYEQNLAQYHYLKDRALPNADEMIQAAQLGYKTGDITYVEYLYTLQTAVDTQLNYLKSIQQVNESVVRIYSLLNR